MLIVLESLLWILRFLFGACIFSFLNVVIDRIPRGESIVRGRSHCTNCSRVLGVAELVPVFSFLVLRGRCKGCGSKIPKRDFGTEVLGGLLFIACGLRWGFGSLDILSLQGAVVFAYLGILLVVALIDQDTQLIYDRFHICILILAVAGILLFPEHTIPDRLLGAVIISVPMLVLTLLVPGAFGGGDIKLMAVSGLFLGAAPVVCAMFLGLVGGGAYAALMLVTGRLGKKDHFAFGPYLALGLAIAAFYGDRIAGWYLRLL